MVSLAAAVASNYAAHYAVLRRDSTDIAVGDAAGSRNRATISFKILIFMVLLLVMDQVLLQ